MHFYKKIFIALLGLIMITPLFADDYICDPGEYINTCTFKFPAYGIERTVENIAPEQIFTFIAWYTYMLDRVANPTNMQHYGYLCWDFEEPKNNWDNLRKLFNPKDDDKLSCYLFPEATLVNVWSALSLNTAPTMLSVSIEKDTYEPYAEWLKNACDHNDVDDHPDWCKACDSVLSKGASYDDSSNKWTVFSTKADCYTGTDESNTVTDITGEFYYDNTSTDPTKNACYYSGD